MPRHIHSTGLVLKSIKTNFYGVLYALVFVTHLFFYTTALSQRTKIDSLKKELKTLRDSAKVDCLNILSLSYSYLNMDTAKSYAQKAYTAASSVNYLRGMAMALNNNARIAGHGLHDFPLQEKISFQTIQFYKNGYDKKVLSEAYMNLALAFFFQGNFDRSTDACNTVIQLSKLNTDKKATGEALSVLGSISLETGNYEKSFEYFNESLGVFKSINDSYNTAIVLARVGDFYRLAGDHKTALNFYSQSLEYPKGSSLEWHPLVDLGDTYYSLEQFDSSLNNQENYSETIKSLTIRSNYIALPKIRMAEMQIANKEYNKALALLSDELKTAALRNEKNQVMRLLLDMGRAYKGKKDHKKVIFYANEVIRNAREYKAKQYIRDGYRLKYIVYDQLHNVDSAYTYLQKYISMKDSVALDDFTKKLAIYKTAKESEKKQGQIEILSNEKLISQQQLQISKQQLKNGAFQKNILIISTMLLLLFGFIIFRNIMLKQKNAAHLHEIEKQELSLQKLESERAKGELQQQATEMEMQALRAQMNPHFIFNSLNSINRFILQNNKTQASEYLTKFSKLVRLILQNSQYSVVSLESELEALQLYLELEALRFDHHFEYKIIIDKELDISSIKVPPLIIQPYAENAIWHGLMNKEEVGLLQIELHEQDEMLYCKITDDGIGRKKATELKSKSASTHKSMGMQITASRIAMMKKDEQTDTQIKITDLVLPDGSAAGTEVLLKIPVCYD